MTPYKRRSIRAAIRMKYAEAREIIAAGRLEIAKHPNPVLVAEEIEAVKALTMAKRFEIANLRSRLNATAQPTLASFYRLRRDKS